MIILTIGDVVGSCGLNYLQDRLWQYRDKTGVDFVVANGENVTNVRGLSRADAEALLRCGVDLITLGNHAFGMKDLYGFLDEDERIIRPANYPAGSPGNGYVIRNVDGWRILFINVQGTVFMEPLNSPFEAIERILSRESGQFDSAVIDVHAESTSEKLAVARTFSGQAAVIFGTHTHVATADEQILPGGTGYITDIGMTGAVDSILGTVTENVLVRFRTHLPAPMDAAAGKASASGALFTVDPAKNTCTALSRISF